MGHFCPQFYLTTAEVYGNLLSLTQQTSLEDKSAIEGYGLCLIVHALPPEGLKQTQQIWAALQNRRPFSDSPEATDTPFTTQTHLCSTSWAAT